MKKHHHEPSYPVKDSYRDAARNTTTNQLPAEAKQPDANEADKNSIPSQDAARHPDQADKEAHR